MNNACMQRDASDLALNSEYRNGR